METSTRLIRLSLVLTALSLSLHACSNKRGSFEQGKKVYEANCVSCHQLEGTGLGKLYPPLRGSDFWRANTADIPCVIRHGLSQPVKVNGQLYTTPMAGLQHLTPYEITNVINYINKTWYPEAERIELKTVEEQLKRCE